MKKEQIHQIHLMRAECRTSSELTVPGCTEYTVTPEPDAREPWRKRKTGLDAAEWPKRAGDMSEHLPAVDSVLLMLSQALLAVMYTFTSQITIQAQHGYSLLGSSRAGTRSEALELVDHCLSKAAFSLMMVNLQY